MKMDMANTLKMVGLVFVIGILLIQVFGSFGLMQMTIPGWIGMLAFVTLLAGTIWDWKVSKSEMAILSFAAVILIGIFGWFPAMWANLIALVLAVLVLMFAWKD